MTPLLQQIELFTKKIMITPQDFREAKIEPSTTFSAHNYLIRPDEQSDKFQKLWKETEEQKINVQLHSRIKKTFLQLRQLYADIWTHYLNEMKEHFNIKYISADQVETHLKTQWENVRSEYKEHDLPSELEFQHYHETLKGNINNVNIAFLDNAFHCLSDWYYQLKLFNSEFQKTSGLIDLPIGVLVGWAFSVDLLRKNGWLPDVRSKIFDDNDKNAQWFQAIKQWAISMMTKECIAIYAPNIPQEYAPPTISRKEQCQVAHRNCSSVSVVKSAVLNILVKLFTFYPVCIHLSL